jgi:hypothetical protein
LDLPGRITSQGPSHNDSAPKDAEVPGLGMWTDWHLRCAQAGWEVQWLGMEGRRGVSGPASQGRNACEVRL